MEPAIRVRSQKRSEQQQKEGRGGGGLAERSTVEQAAVMSGG